MGDGQWKTKTIPFSGAMTLIVSIFVFVFYYYDIFPDDFFVIRVFGLSTIYTFLSLVSNNSKEILKKTIEQVWDISRTDGITPKERKDIILNFLEIAVSRWNKYWIMFQKIVLGNEPLQTKKEKLKNLISQIFKGEINIFQAIWIFTYLVYSILIGANIFQIPGPIDFLVNIGFFLVILFESGSIIGIGKFIMTLFETMSFESVKEVGAQLATLERLIMNGSKAYYLFDLQ